MSSTSATTTYSFTYTTFTNPTPVAFTKPTEFPTIFSFGSAVGCSSNLASATATATASAVPSNAPLDHPNGREAACVISNDAEINDHAFWDLYACCKGGDMNVLGSPMLCTAQCKPKDGQTWQELGECLSKKVEVVVCKPAFAEIPTGAVPTASASASGSNAPSTTSASGTHGGAASGPSQASGTGGATGTFATPATTSKVALVVFGIVALGSAMGILL